MSCLLCTDGSSLLATVFSGFPERLRSHGVRIGTVAGIMARYVGHSAIPGGMEPAEYQNAVRYGGLYHDIGAYLAFNDYQDYPAAGARFLSQELPRHMIGPENARIMIECVNPGRPVPPHAGICALAAAADGFRSFASAQKYIERNTEAFTPEAVRCFRAAQEEIAELYKKWRKHPPLCTRRDAAPLYKTIDRPFG